MDNPIKSVLDLVRLKCLKSHQIELKSAESLDRLICCSKCEETRIDLEKRLWVVEYLIADFSGKKISGYRIGKKVLILLDDELQAPFLKAHLLNLEPGTKHYRRADKAEASWWLADKVARLEKQKLA